MKGCSLTEFPILRSLSGTPRLTGIPFRSAAMLALGPAVAALGALVGLPARAPARASLRSLSMSEPPVQLIDEYPTPSRTPIGVVQIQLLAMQQEDRRIFWRFVSPEGKRDTGILRPSRRAYLVPPLYHTLPVYAPLVGCQHFEIVGALRLDEAQYQCRARVWPAPVEEPGGLPSLPVEYIFRLALQPLVRPSCYEDDPLQQGISTGPPFGGCWLVDDVRLDDNWNGDNDSDEIAPKPPPVGGGEAKPRSAPARVRELVLA